eukprot:g18458.t1
MCKMEGEGLHDAPYETPEGDVLLGDSNMPGEGSSLGDKKGWSGSAHENAWRPRRSGTREEDAARKESLTMGAFLPLAIFFVTSAVVAYLCKGGARVPKRSLESSASSLLTTEHVDFEHAESATEETNHAHADDGDADDARTKRSLGSAQFLPSRPSCPYIIPTEEDADRRGHDASVPGNVLVLQNFNYSRLGNRFVTLSRNLSLGFCCKSKLVSLPAKDDVLAPGILNMGTPGPRIFDFSQAPDVEGFDASSCPSHITWGGTEAFHLSGLRDEGHLYYTPGLFECVKTLPPVIGCEAAYLLPTDIDICQSDYHDENDDGNQKATASGVRLEWRDDKVGGVRGRGGHKVAADLRGGAGTLRTGNATLGVDRENEGKGSEFVMEGETQKWAPKKGKVAGNLVMHVRSGDIFVNPAHPAYGQPPLQFYLRAIEDRRWARVDVVTNGFPDEQHALNPIVPALEEKVASGDLPANIHFHKNRSIAEDIVSMICADGFVAARSTLRHLVSHQSIATRMYFPTACDEKLSVKDTRPGVKVFGMTSQEEEDYTVFQRWNNTPAQLAEMFTFNVTGFQQCIDGSDAAR